MRTCPDHSRSTQPGVAPAQESAIPTERNPGNQHSDGHLWEVIGELSQIVFVVQPLDDTLQQICELTKRVLPPLAEVSITVLEDSGQTRTVAATGPLAVDLDEHQHKTGYGPCMDAAITGLTVQVDHTRPRSPYPDFSRSSADHGITHSTSIGLPCAASMIGAMNLYLNTNSLDPTTLALATEFAEYAALAISNTNGYADTVNQADQLRKALHSRKAIQQARGILMARHDCSDDEAFGMLIRASREQNHRELRDIAEAIIAGNQPKSSPS